MKYKAVFNLNIISEDTYDIDEWHGFFDHDMYLEIRDELDEFEKITDFETIGSHRVQAEYLPNGNDVQLILTPWSTSINGRQYPPMDDMLITEKKKYTHTIPTDESE
jgi:hypothetical protein